MSTNPRPRPALRKAPNEGHPAAIEEPTPKKAEPKKAEPKQTATKQAAPKKRTAKGTLGKGSTSDTLRGTPLVKITILPGTCSESPNRLAA